ncbi:DoxX family protein [Aneurinibacillus migulanus]|uniref:DoxX family protein n=1 Tax=Aneurinibacillus migulanus TaxID=47500 RepID=UPI00209F6BF4|nr:DoxX family protein [Aneurinibacillus migulanus]MCP1358392.1 DoxX family protein [Aneurinibacillus migulanus]
MKIASIVLQIILALDFIFAGTLKLSRAKMMVEHWNAYRYPKWLMFLVGIIEILGAAGMIGGIWIPYFAIVSGIVLAIFMAGAIYTHIFRAHHPIKMASHAFIVFVLCMIVVLLHLA